MILNIDVKAKLTIYSTEIGGRKTPICNKYRPNHVFEYKENSKDYMTTYIGQIEFEKDLFYPNETGIVKVSFLDHQNIRDLLSIGKVWWIHEGQNIIGEAKILEIFN